MASGATQHQMSTTTGRRPTSLIGVHCPSSAEFCMLMYIKAKGKALHMLLHMQSNKHPFRD